LGTAVIGNGEISFLFINYEWNTVKPNQLRYDVKYRLLLKCFWKVAKGIEGTERSSNSYDIIVGKCKRNTSI